ncbi:PE-PPE domain-containing protein [Mycobacterium sp. 21AC1]|uniref:PE-PPE domain-containing protein n=1 Tax=[Mycobacterium] appelbergii TaxID=2939269 RepID=UPI00293901E0|nr:PE-PPE domain-containing protein [Mycobacterium sp. 21AC1]MDV3128947.1 PE-PPE domain-containing protein [Mycobacterium sp. 21AC1]
MTNCRQLVVCGAAVATVAALGVTPQVAPVQLAALIIGASSTNPGGDGVSDFYGGHYQQDPTVVANFLTGPAGIYRAIADNRDDDDNVVLSSGWGAANASLLLSQLKATHDPVLSNPTLYVLDNNVASPNGGFGTRLPGFAVIGVNPIPTPTDPGVPVVNVVYEYDINSNIPAYLWNAPAMANSLMAYFERRLNQESLDFPVDATGEVRPDLCDAACQSSLDAGDTVTFTLTGDQVARVKKVDDTTYVSYESQRLPLVAPLRVFGEPGNRLADAATPALRAVVDYGYPDNDPLVKPEKYTPARLLPSRKETRRFVDDFTAGLEQGATMLREDGAAPAHRARPLVRQSLDFSPKARHASAGTTKRPVAGLVKSAIERARTLTKKLRGPSPAGDDDAAPADTTE